MDNEKKPESKKSIFNRDKKKEVKKEEPKIMVEPPAKTMEEPEIKKMEEKPVEKKTEKVLTGMSGHPIARRKHNTMLNQKPKGIHKYLGSK